jgi:hypothetical protein
MEAPIITSLVGPPPISCDITGFGSHHSRTQKTEAMRHKRSLRLLHFSACGLLVVLGLVAPAH